MTLRPLPAGLIVLVLAAGPADAAVIYGISNGGTTLIRFNSTTPGTVTVIGNFSGNTTTLRGLDFRPADGLLYGYNQATNGVYTVNVNTAATTFVAPPSMPSTTPDLGIDFDPVADRLRLVNIDDQNLEIDPATGVTVPGVPLAYAPADPNFGANPFVNEAAYTNSFPPSPRAAPGTQLYYLDYALDILATTTNPGTGQLTTVGLLGVDTSSFTGFDIFYDPTTSTNVAFASLRVNLVDQFYTVDLTTGAATFVGNLGAIDVLSVAAAPAAVPEPAGVALVGPGAAGLVGWRRRVRKGQLPLHRQECLCHQGRCILA